MKKICFLLGLVFFVAKVTAQPDGMVLIKGEKTENSTEPDFYIDKYEVTIADFEKFVKATGYVPSTDKKGYSISIKNFGVLGRDTLKGANWKCDALGKPRPKENYNYPVMHISYNDAIEYAKWAKKRLPTEKEWMYVASSKSVGRMKERIWFMDNSKRADGAWDTRAVGLKKPNSFGVYDIFGNVAEFVLDKQDRKILKGGCFWSFSDEFEDAHSITRISIVKYADYTESLFGFRCAKTL